MKNISISTSFDYSIPIEKQIPMIKKAGFTHITIGGNYEHSGILEKERLKELSRLIKTNSLSVDTIHGFVLDKIDSIQVNSMIVDAATILEAPVVVVHCSSFTFNAVTLEERKKDISLKIKILESISEQSGVRFAIENVLLGVATDFAEEIIKSANPDYFGFCYDSAHDQIGGPNSFALLERLKHRLFAVHISDRIAEFIDHCIPGEGFIDFNAICTILKDLSNNFPLLMEVMVTNSKYKEPDEFLKETFKKAQQLYEAIF